MQIRNLSLQIMQINNGDKMKYLKSYDSLNEGFDNLHKKYPYNCIITRIVDVKDLYRYINIVERNKISDTNDLLYNIKHKLENGIICCGRIYIDGSGRLSTSGNSLDVLEKYDIHSKFTHTTKLFTVNELDFILPEILKNGITKPTYEPKRIIRTIESFKDFSN